MSNIIKVKEERNVLSFDGEVFNLVANSTNFYLKFELDSEWELNSVITVIFNFDGKNEYVELDENRMCQIPPTNSSRVWFCITTEPDEISKLSSTILSLDVEESGETDTSEVEFYQNTHKNLMGVVQDLLTGNNIKAKNAEFADVAHESETQVSLDGDEDVAGVKNFTGTILHNSNHVLDSANTSQPNIIINGNFLINSRHQTLYTRRGTDIYTVDRWGIFQGNGSYNTISRAFKGLDETTPSVLCQWIEDTKNVLTNGKITISATINSIRYSQTIELPTSPTADVIFNIYECEDFVFRAYLNKSLFKLGVQFVVVNGVSIKIEKVKVEVSDFETRYIERTTAEETFLCQRYYQENIVSTIGFAMSSSNIIFPMFLTTTIRNVVSYNYLTYPLLSINGVTSRVETIKPMVVGPTGITMLMTGSDFDVNVLYPLSGGNMSLDGEIYLW